MQEEYLTTASEIIFAEQELARQKELNEGNAGAKKNLQSTTAELSSLQTRRASLQQQIQLMGINLNSLSNENLKSILGVTSPIGAVSYTHLGTHTVEFRCVHDKIELTHDAFSRGGFVAGVVTAAEWLKGRVGFYGMDDLFN